MNYLESITIKKRKEDIGFPFNLPFLKNGEIKIDTSCPVTILVGDNGIGKSTILESIAYKIGFNPTGGTASHYYEGNGKDNLKLSEIMTLSFNQKTTKGFFLRAESLTLFSKYIDDLAQTDPGILYHYGGKSLNEQSHGEAFLSIFDRFDQGIIILDEPESALTPTRQLQLLALIHQLEKSCQFIIATHSPILMTYPNANLYHITEDSVKKCSYKDLEHYQITKSFLENPERYYKHLFEN